MSSEDAEDLLEELEDRRKTWTEKGFSDYTMTVEIGCFCPKEQQGPFEVTVVDGKLDTVTMNGESVTPVDETLLTIEGLFSTIEDHSDADEITITYSRDGYPTAIDINPSHEIVDEELRIDVHDLTPINP